MAVLLVGLLEEPLQILHNNTISVFDLPWGLRVVSTGEML